MNKLDQIKSELHEILGREPTCATLKTGKFLADYMKVGTPVSQLIGDTEEEAFEKLLVYLKSKPQTESA